MEEECLFLWSGHLGERTLEAVLEYAAEATKAAEDTAAAATADGGDAGDGGNAAVLTFGAGEEEDAPLNIDPTGSGYSYCTMSKGGWEALCTAETPASAHAALQVR